MKKKQHPGTRASLGGIFAEGSPEPARPGLESLLNSPLQPNSHATSAFGGEFLLLIGCYPALVGCLCLLLPTE